MCICIAIRQQPFRMTKCRCRQVAYVWKWVLCACTVVAGRGAAFPQHSLYRLGALRSLYNDTTFYYHFIINGIYMAIGCWSIKRGIAVNSIGHSLIKYSFLIFWLISSQLILKICCLFLSYRDFISLKFYVLKHRGTIT